MTALRRIHVLAAAAALLVSTGAAQARPLTPAEQRDAPYSGLVRPCEDPMATGYIQGAFADREDEYWHSGLRIVGWRDVEEIGFRSNGLDYIPRRYCLGHAIMSDQKVRTVSFSIVEEGGSIGFTDSVEWCVTGLDRDNAFSPACKMARPDMKALAFALTLLSAVVTWQSPADAASDCVLDNCADRRSMVPQRQSGSGHADRDFRRNGYGPRGASVSGSFDFYVLSLSWSPGFCATGGDEKGRDQCRAGADLGFTVHGLWPQYEHGYPSDCNGTSRFPSRSALASTAGVYPDEGLARYEWRKHGACSGLSPNDYFAAAKAARDTVVVPPLLKEPHEARTMAPLDVEHAFIDANPRLRPGMIAAVCKNGTMDEVRICFTKDLKAFQVCPEVVRQRCRSASMTIPPVR